LVLSEDAARRRAARHPNNPAKAMSTRLEAPNHPSPQPDPDAEVEKKKALDLSLTQVVGGALAAMTAAALGSTLGVGGTIAGAAFASVVAGVAGSLYTASLRSGRDKVVTVFRGPGPDASSAPPASLAPAAVTSREALQETVVVPVWDPLPLEKPAKKSRARADFPWRRAVAVSLAVFALAAVLITGYERFSGQPLSGGTGTTVSQVRQDPGGTDDTEAKPAPSTSPSSTPSTDSSTPSEAPSTGQETPTPSESPESPSPTESESTPDPTATPSLAGAGAEEAPPTTG
jgi:hypothetical protein